MFIKANEFKRRQSQPEHTESAMNTFFVNGSFSPKKNLGLILICAIVAGCSPDKPSATPAATGKITIRGSNTVGEELAPQLIAEYKKEHPAAEFDLESKGTSYGMGALMGGYCDISGASRLPTKEELEVAQYRNVELNDHVIGTYAVAVVVNPGNVNTNLTRGQVRDIFTGTIQNWKDVGGPDATVHLYIRDPMSGTYMGFKELAMENKSYAPDPKMLTLCTNYEDIAQAVAKDPNGIGYTGMNLAKDAGARVVPIGGVQPGVRSVQKGEYPYTRTLHLYTSKGNETPATMDFIQFVLSARGQEVVARTGDVPNP
jgi:phosphate transport system substrate-binding protein